MCVFINKNQEVSVVTKFDKSEKFLVQKNIGDDIVFPARATTLSAGYDFVAPDDFSIKPGEKVLIFTNVKVLLKPNEFMLLAINSGRAIKEQIVLANQIGIIDSDYKNNKKTDGNIGVCLKNEKPAYKLVPKTITLNAFEKLEVATMQDLTEYNTFHFKKGDVIAQGIILTYNTLTQEEVPTKEREGGFGHTREQGDK